MPNHTRCRTVEQTHTTKGLAAGECDRLLAALLIHVPSRIRLAISGRKTCTHTTVAK